MGTEFRDDRLAQLLFARDERAEVADVRLRLDGMAIVLTIDPDAAASDWGQAAAGAIALCGSRMFRAGVFLRAIPDVPARYGKRVGQPLRRTLEDLGCRTAGEAPKAAMRLHIGRDGRDAQLYIVARGWAATVSPSPITDSGRPSNPVAGVLAAAMALSEAFRRLALGALDAARVRQDINAWAPGMIDLSDGFITRVPSALWILGAGNLGQATSFILSMLPFADRRDVRLFIQDFDRSGPENLSTQILTGHDWLGRRKAAAVSDHMDLLGFETFAIERRFAEGQGPGPDEPRIALVGVDNAKARRAAAAAGFDLVIDAGLGGTPAEILDLAIRMFPGGADPAEVWPDTPPEARPLPERYRKLVAAGVLDMCGATTIAGQPVGVPSTALAAAAIQIAQLCRALATGTCCDAVDLRLARCADVFAADRDESGIALPALPALIAMSR